MQIFLIFRRIIQHLARSYASFYVHSGAKITASAYLGVVAMPGYYLLWENFSPQEYESVSLRVACALLCAGGAVRAYWPASWRRYEMAYVYVAIMLTLPALLSFLTLMNGASLVWQLTTIAAFIFVIYLYDTLNAAVVTVVGVTIGFVFFLMSGQQPNWHPTVIPYLGVLGFVIFGMLALSYNERLITEEKVQSAYATAAHVAHEVRTPLAAIRFETEKLSEFFPRADEKDAVETALSPRKSYLVGKSLGRVSDHIKSTTNVIDTILTNVARESAQEQQIVHDMGETIRQALSDYHFKSGQRATLETDLTETFSYRGSDILISHVVFNLLKNGMRAVMRRGSGGMTIALKRTSDGNQLIVSDTGNGIAKRDLPFVFVPFYTTERAGTGTGIGLSFCREIISRMNGTIVCQSSEGEGTVFTITLPDPDTSAI